MSSDNITLKSKDTRTLSASSTVVYGVVGVCLVLILYWVLKTLGVFKDALPKSKKTLQLEQVESVATVSVHQKKKEDSNKTENGKGVSSIKDIVQSKKENPYQNSVEKTKERESRQDFTHLKEGEHVDLTKNPAASSSGKPKPSKDINIKKGKKEKEKEKEIKTDENNKNAQKDDYLETMIGDLDSKLKPKILSTEISGDEMAVVNGARDYQKSRDKCLTDLLGMEKSRELFDRDLLYNYVTTVTDEDRVFFRKIADHKSEDLFWVWCRFFRYIYIDPNFITQPEAEGKKSDELFDITDSLSTDMTNEGLKHINVSENYIDAIVNLAFKQIHTLQHQDKLENNEGSCFYDGHDTLKQCKDVVRRFYVQPSQMGFKGPTTLLNYFKAIEARYKTLHLHLYLCYHKQRLGL